MAIDPIILLRERGEGGDKFTKLVTAICVKIKLVLKQYLEILHYLSFPIAAIQQTRKITKLYNILFSNIRPKIYWEFQN